MWHRRVCQDARKVWGIYDTPIEHLGARSDTARTPQTDRFGSAWTCQGAFISLRELGKSDRMAAEDREGQGTVARKHPGIEWSALLVGEYIIVWLICSVSKGMRAADGRDRCRFQSSM